MKDIRIKNGDIVIENNDILLVQDSRVLAQKVELLLATMKGEWFLNEDEGINRELIFVKENQVDEEMIQDAVYDVLMQIDETFELDEFETDYSNRNLIIRFVAHTNQETIEIKTEL